MQTEQPTELESCLDSITEKLEKAAVYFGHGTDNAWDEACWLVKTVLSRHGQSKFEAGIQLTAVQLREIDDILQRRIEDRKPLAYLLNEAWFAGQAYYVDERVLVPRSPLAELILQSFDPFLHTPPERILDLCTGSGCIGLACAKVFPNATVELADISAGALEVANINVERHTLQTRVTTQLSDLFEDLQGRFDLIVTNPPYVPLQEYQTLPEEYTREPELGLLSDDKGLAIPRRILETAEQYLTEDGLLFLEVGNTQELLETQLPQYPFLWIEFEHGGHGVCMLTARQLREANLR